jgi:hypothetical protein
MGHPIYFFWTASRANASEHKRTQANASERKRTLTDASE